jgi:hypothetical protein
VRATARRRRRAEAGFNTYAHLAHRLILALSNTSLTLSGLRAALHAQRTGHWTL